MTPLAVGLEEASAMIGISARTLRKMASDGRVPSVKLGSRLLFRVQDLEMVLAQAVKARRPQ
jgi:excisionase family DNA binding protein